MFVGRNSHLIKFAINLFKTLIYQNSIIILVVTYFKCSTIYNDVPYLIGPKDPTILI